MSKLTDSDKIGIIFSKVGKIETDVALIKKGDEEVLRNLNSHEGRLNAIDEVILAYKLEKAKLVGIAVASGTIFTSIGAFVIWLLNYFYSKHN